MANGAEQPDKQPEQAVSAPKKAPDNAALEAKEAELEQERQKILDNAKTELESLQSTFKQDLNGRYAEKFDEVMNDIEPDLEGDDNPENVVWRKARGIAITAIASEIEGAQKKAGKFIKRDVVHEFAEALIRDYVTKMDEKAEQLAFNIGVLHESELDPQKNPDMRPLTFDDWLGIPPRYPEDQLYEQLDMQASKEFAGNVGKVGAELAKIRDEGLDLKFQKFFATEKARIQKEALSNPEAAKESLQTAEQLSQNFAKARVLSKLIKDLDARLNDVAGLKEKVADLDPALEEGYKKERENIAMLIDAFVASGKGKMDYDVKMIVELDKKLAGVKELARTDAARAEKAVPAGPAAEAEQVAESAEQPPDPMEDPDAFLVHMGNEMGPFGKLIVGFLAGSPFFAKFKTWMGTMKGKYGVEGFQEAAPQIALSLTFMREKFGFHGDEALAFSDQEVAQVLRMDHPPAGVRQEPFDLFIAALRRNGATNNTIATVPGFLRDHEEHWIDPPSNDST